MDYKNKISPIVAEVEPKLTKANNEYMLDMDIDRHLSEYDLNDEEFALAKNLLLMRRANEEPIEKKPAKRPIPTIALNRMSDLRKQEIERPDFLVDGIIPIGCGILAGPPKVGKSWLSLDLVLSLSEGGKFLGYRCNKCGVLYLALEDSAFRLQDRLNKMLGNAEVDDRCYFSLEAPKTSEGLLTQIEGCIEKEPSIRMVIVDTYQKVRKPSKRGADQYEEGYQELSDIHNFALKHNIGILLIHHAKKSSGLELENPFDNILGSVSLQGATDYMMILQKKKDGKIINGNGRDFMEYEMQVHMNEDTCRWINEGSPEEMEKMQLEFEYRSSPLVKYIKSTIAVFGQCEAHARQLQGAVSGIDEEVGVLTLQAFGKLLSKYDMQFARDGIEHEMSRDRQGTIHRFYKA